MARETKPDISVDDARHDGDEAAATKSMSAPTSAPTAVTVAPDKKKSANKKSGKAADSDAPATHEAAPTAAGDRSLIRALGLKIGRIVIDAGHGGHDTGTIGPNGLQEKGPGARCSAAVGEVAGVPPGRRGDLHPRRRHVHPAGDANGDRQRTSGGLVHLGAREFQPRRVSPGSGDVLPQLHFEARMHWRLQRAKMRSRRNRSTSCRTW